MENRIRDLREDHDLTQTGQQQLTADILIKLADFYDVSIDYILRQTQTPRRLK